MLQLILLVAALVLFALAALNTTSEKVNLGWAGAFCAALALVLGRWSL